MDVRLVERIAVCERTNRGLVRVVSILSLALVSLATLLAASCASGLRSGMAAERGGSLRVHEIVVVDPNGVERVRIGGDLPDAVIDGKRVARGEKAAGVLLYDDTGQERGGYVTWSPSGNVGLTLDTRRRQVALFVAGPDSASALSLREGDDMIELRSDSDGSRITAVTAGKVVLQQPPIALGPEACAAYHESRARYSVDEILVYCQQRYTEAACRACLTAAP